MPAETILLVDAETNILDMERMYLEREGFRIFSVKTGFDALDSFRTIHPDVIILALMLPGLDGFEVCRRLRSENNQVPVIAIYSKDEVISGISGTDLEADDYLAKPFNPRELVARVKTVLHRGHPLSQRLKTTIQLKNLTIDQVHRNVSVEGKVVPMRTQEYEILALLMRDPGKFLTREYLLREGWGYDFAGQTATVDLHIARLQAKLCNSGVSILSDPQSGYKLQA